MLAGLAAPANPGSQSTDTCPLAHLGLHDSTWVVRIVSGAPGRAQCRGRHVHPTGPCHLASALNSRSRMPTDPTCRGGVRSQHLSREPEPMRVPEPPGMLSLPCQVPPFPSPRQRHGLRLPSARDTNCRQPRGRGPVSCQAGTHGHAVERELPVHFKLIRDRQSPARVQQDVVELEDKDKCS